MTVPIPDKYDYAFKVPGVQLTKQENGRFYSVADVDQYIEWLTKKHEVQLDTLLSALIERNKSEQVTYDLHKNFETVKGEL